MNHHAHYANQDRAGRLRSGMGVFCDGVLLCRVDERADPYGYTAVAAAQEQAPGRYHEVLLICPTHPDRSAVDCTDCTPIEEDHD